MADDPPDTADLDSVIRQQNNEAQLHWSRNSYFLVVISILVLAYGLRPAGNSMEADWFQALVIGLGFALSVMWLMIQYRSSGYIGYYKQMATGLAQKLGRSNPFPLIQGTEMRKVTMALPIIFMVFWVGLAVALASTLA